MVGHRFERQTTLHPWYDYSMNSVIAKPFLKWAGGKTQILSEIVKRIPDRFKRTKTIPVYVEPFVGGGAVFFYLKHHFNIKKSVLLDANPELILIYNIIQTKVECLIQELSKISNAYFKLASDARKEEYYYSIRSALNQQLGQIDYKTMGARAVKRVAYLIFLNKTCYNGLFRLNRKGEFNVPFGRYKKPNICDAENLIAASGMLSDSLVICGDFEDSQKYIHKNCLVYFDPPYRPLNATSSFTNYAKNGFNDDDQKRLAQFYRKIDKKGTALILSNSDPKNGKKNDNFFDDLYAEFSIHRIQASRMINSNSKGRGQISELLITNS
jgi:DNA adenine methylase